ncbi:MAG: ABC transporter permease [Gemmatimonadaceae bacterium]
MSLISQLQHRFRFLLRRKEFDRDLAEEIELHVDLLARDRVSGGMSPDDARLAARRAFGNVTRLQEESRRAWHIPPFDTVIQDLRHALRGLRRNPVFAATAIVSLALGIGANLAIFSAIYSTLLEPLGYRDPERLVWISGSNPSRGWTDNPISPAVMTVWRERNHVFSGIAAFQPSAVTLTGSGEPIEVPVQRTTPNVFSLLGVRPMLGRDFVEDDAIPNGPVRVVLSYNFWKRQFAGDASIVGREIAFNDAGGTVIGVMPEGFTDRYAAGMAAGTLMWIASWDPTLMSNEYGVLARLRPGATLPAAQREMDAISREIEAEQTWQVGWRAAIGPLRDQIVGPTRTTLLVLFGATLFVALIACTNVTNLLLARGAAREREMTVRAVLGATRKRLTRQLLTEGTVLGVAGGAIGVGVALLGARLLQVLAPPGAAPADGKHLIGTLLGYTAISIVAAVLIFALAPALSMSDASAKGRLDTGGRGSTQGTRSLRLRSGLIIMEFALAVMLSVGAGLMIRTLRAIGTVPIGVDAKDVMAMWIPLRSRQYQPMDRYIAFWRALMPRVSAIPGVVSASLTRGVPVDGWAGMSFVATDRPAPAAGEAPAANYVIVGPDYFTTMGIPLLAGRPFTQGDDESSPRVVIVNEELAKRIWPGENALGRTIRSQTSDSLPRTIVGIASNVRSRGVFVPPQPETYFPYGQTLNAPMRPHQLVVRTSGDAAGVITAIRREVAALDRTQPVVDVKSMSDIIGRPVAQQRFLAALLTAFGVLALTLAAIGIYGVVAYAVVQRTREFGVRMALGAQRGDVLRRVLGGSIRLAAVGIVLGMLGGLGLTRYLATLLFGVRSTDAATFAVVAVGLTLVAAVAAAIPAGRAARVDPAVALRGD